MSNRDGKPELSRIEKMIEEEDDPKQRAILILLHYLTVSVTTSLDKINNQNTLLDKYGSIIETYGSMINKASGFTIALKIIFAVTHTLIISLIILSLNSIINVRDTVTVNSVRITNLEENTKNLENEIIAHDTRDRL